MLCFPAPQNRPTSGRGAAYYAEGDSITVGSGAIGYPVLFGAIPANRVSYCGTLAVPGATLDNNAGNSLVERAAADDALLSNGLGSRYILSVLIHNGITVLGIDSFISGFAAYLDARRAAGWKVIFCTMLPATGSNFNTLRNTANATFVTWGGVHADAICDFGAHPIMGADATASDTTYYQDGTHPTLLGQQILSGVIAPILNSLATP